MPEAMLAARGITRRFGGLVAVNDVSLDLHRGTVHAVIGTNGAGKSTLINILSGELLASAGQVLLEGRDITAWPQPQRARGGLGRSYQRSTIFPTLSVHENCRLAAQAGRQQFWHWWRSAADCPHSTERAHQVLERTGLANSAATPAGLLPHGHKRQLEIAMCLASHPQVLLLDEPLAGMGPEETERILALLQSLKAEHAILLVEHDMDAVFGNADIITVMVNGSAIACGTPAQIRANPQVQNAYLGDGPCMH
ncbi:ABC transporter ATP-binding protein [Bordetella sp. BOR01]|uniref:ABC transporter ATP-binding protein n=1 Tax=Bordetella sp. BOR01 TaxID=2854779 RepID=UPI001C43AED2|nr:ABC transporter ATP-binding protein [Bordetella sp. BOR01]MBV7484193.1 ABC transporter ATP-binding protein [Bordetella sp. BOR01]